MNTLIISGGTTDEIFLKNYLSNNMFDSIIAVDKGLEVLNKLKIEPNYIIGDFDSLDLNVLKVYDDNKIIRLEKEKDYTDTHMALKLAIENHSKNITIIGGIGTRIDHTLGNIGILKEALENNVSAKIINENNEIMLIKNSCMINKNDKFKYISLIPLTTLISGVTLEGLKYKLDNATINAGESIGISNEQIEDTAKIIIQEGIAILIFSKD